MVSNNQAPEFTKSSTNDINPSSLSIYSLDVPQIRASLYCVDSVIKHLLALTTENR